MAFHSYNFNNLGSLLAGQQQAEGKGGGGGGSLVKECRLSDGGRCGGGYAFPSITGRGS